jgi:aminoglycoside phosphotransferase (APT) family kinase protein
LIVEGWEARDAAQWVHGDLHLANAMSRESMESGPVCLIDLAEVRAGHWVEDAVYLERQLWARPERIKRHGPVKAIAAARRRRALPVDDDYPRLAAIRRALLAATAPSFLRSEGDPRYLEACLDRLTHALDELK